MIRPPNPESATFAARLREAMTKRRVTATWIATRLGLSNTAVSYWRTGTYLPSISVGERLAEVLDWPALLTSLVAARTRRCANISCGAVFERKHDEKRIFCSTQCQVLVAGKRRLRVNPRQSAIDAMCAACEPDGVCRTADCPLRAFSPFLYIPMTAA